MSTFPKVAQFRTARAFRAHLERLGIDLPVDDAALSAAEGSPLAEPLAIGPHRAGNRWGIHPMEGWDAHRDGAPSELTLRRWRHFGLSGAKLIWGGEAAAVEPAGRANPRQMLAVPENRTGLATCLHCVLEAHASAFGGTDGLIVGLQLTHSGRFCRPHENDRPEPRIAYRHPLLDRKFGLDESTGSRCVLSDDDVERLVDRYVTAAGVAEDVGFYFVDVKACHGYLVHEFLGAFTRPGRFGGDFDGRTRLLRTIVGRIRDTYPGLTVGVRLSVFDTPPFTGDPQETGRPMDFADLLPYRYAFGVDQDDPLACARESAGEPEESATGSVTGRLTPAARRGHGHGRGGPPKSPDSGLRTPGSLDEPLKLIGILRDLGVAAINVSCGSPYYNPHLQRPAIFPPSDGYQPPEDPLLGVARQIHAARWCKRAYPDVPMIGSGYSYLQEYLPHVAQAVVRAGWIDGVGIGRMVLADPTLPADVLAGRPLARKRICRTFSDCTTAPRHGLVSGCYPLDAFYKALPEAERLKAIKRRKDEGRW